MVNQLGSEWKLLDKQKTPSIKKWLDVSGAESRRFELLHPS